MTAANQAARFDCVIFDCDGVLVDSEPIVHRVLNRVLNELGIEITLEESMKWFLGRAVRDELGNIEARCEFTSRGNAGYPGKQQCVCWHISVEIP